MKRKLHRRVLSALMLVLICFVMAVPQSTAAASYTGQETSIKLLDTVVGRYHLNYTGNTNHFAYWNTNGSTERNYIYNDTNGPYANSSTAALSRTTGASGIKRAFLVWETREPAGAVTAVGFIAPDGQRMSVSPTYAINDWRAGEGWGYRTMFCMAADVTTVVRNAGYGNYSVYNIPRYDANEDRVGSGTPAGESPGSWQLIVLEEGDDFPVRAVSLTMGSEFRFKTNYNTSLSFGSMLKSRASGDVTGQIFFGASNSNATQQMTETITSYTGSGGYIRRVVSHTTSSAGLYRNGSLVNQRDYQKGCIRMDLSDVSGIGNNASRFDLTVENNGWSSFFFLGAAVDIAYPEFIGEQVTRVNSAESVTVTGSFTNTATIQDTGIYSGNMTVTLDDGLEVLGASAVVNGTMAIEGSISGQTVTFSGSELSSMMNGDSVSYTVECATYNSGRTRFDNTAGFHGYLRSDGVNTGYWIERMWTASSFGIPMYTVALEKGEGVESVTGAGTYSCGSPVDIGASLMTGYHWKGWTGSFMTEQQDYSFVMPAQNVTMTAEGEANTYTIVFDPNEGKEIEHLEDIVTRYDAELELPDGSEKYVKYTLDGVNITEDVVLDVPDALEGAEESDVSVETGQSEESDGAQEYEEGWDEEPKPDKRAYESVYMGWGLEETRMGWNPQWEPGTVTVAELARAAGVEDVDSAVIALYAIWDDSPWIQAMNLYYSLEQAQAGFITEAELLSHAAAFDREDGSPIGPGVHENGTSFTIPDYSPTDFTQLTGDGRCTENLTVVDSAGSVYVKQITVHVADTAAVNVEPEGTTRFINEYYYTQPYEYGGLADDSLWRTDPEYVAALRQAFENIRNDTPVKKYYFTHEQMLEMREYVDEHGIGDSREPGAAQEFYRRFLVPGRME